MRRLALLLVVALAVALPVLAGRGGGMERFGRGRRAVPGVLARGTGVAHRAPVMPAAPGQVQRGDRGSGGVGHGNAPDGWRTTLAWLGLGAWRTPGPVMDRAAACTRRALPGTIQGRAPPGGCRTA